MNGQYIPGVIGGLSVCFVSPFWIIRAYIPYKLCEEKITERGRVLSEKLASWNSLNTSTGLCFKSYFYGAYISLELIENNQNSSINQPINSPVYQNQPPIPLGTQLQGEMAKGKYSQGNEYR